MRTRERLLVLITGVLTVLGAAAALLGHASVKPVGTLSRRDVLEIRRVVMRAEVWGLFGLANVTNWPAATRWALTFRILDITEEPIGSTTIHPDGTREKRHFVTVRFRACGWSGYSCRLDRKDGHWSIAPYNPPRGNPLMLLIPSLPAHVMDGGIPVRLPLRGLGPPPVLCFVERECNHARTRTEFDYGVASN